MRSGNRSNALLVELLTVVMFFMLSFTVLLEVFTTARTQSDRAELLTRVLNEAQNAADRLYAAEDAEKELTDMGFEQRDGIWALAKDDFDLTVTVDQTQSAATRHLVQALKNNEPLVTLPVTRYREAQP